MPSLPQFNPARIRSYIFRLPFCTRLLVLAIVGLWIATIPFPWIREFGRLEPAKMDLTQSRWILLYLNGARSVAGIHQDWGLERPAPPEVRKAGRLSSLWAYLEDNEAQRSLGLFRAGLFSCYEIDLEANGIRS